MECWGPKGSSWRGALSLLGAVAAAVLIACNSAGSASAPSTSEQPARPSVTRSPTIATQTSPPAPSPAAIFPPGSEPPSGGDAPAGPSAGRYGTIPENVRLSPEFSLLQIALKQQIDAYAASTGTEAAIAVTDLQTGQTLSVRGNVAQRTGCTINMYALLAITSEFQAGRADPAAVAGLVKIGIGSSYPPDVRAFLDTVFGNYHVGDQRARELRASWGMTASLFDHVPYYATGPQNNLLTALESNLAWTKLAQGDLFDPQWTAYALGKLRDIKPGLNYIVPGQLPAEATVAHKIGYYDDTDGWVVADAGLVTFADSAGQQRAYVITYLSQQDSTEYAGYSFGAKLSRMVWDWMYPRYSNGLPPTPTTTPGPHTLAPGLTPARASTATMTPARASSPTPRTPSAPH